MMGAGARHASDAEADYEAGDASSALSRNNSVAHYSAMRRRGMRRTILRSILVVLLVGLLGFGGLAWAYINNINQRLTAGANQDLLSILAERDKPSDPFYMHVALGRRQG